MPSAIFTNLIVQAKPLLNLFHILKGNLVYNPFQAKHLVVSSNCLIVLNLASNISVRGMTKVYIYILKQLSVLEDGFNFNCMDINPVVYNLIGWLL